MADREPSFDELLAAPPTPAELRAHVSLEELLMRPDWAREIVVPTGNGFAANRAAHGRPPVAEGLPREHPGCGGAMLRGAAWAVAGAVVIAIAAGWGW